MRRGLAFVVVAGAIALVLWLLCRQDTPTPTPVVTAGPSRESATMVSGVAPEPEQVHRVPSDAVKEVAPPTPATREPNHVVVAARDLRDGSPVSALELRIRRASNDMENSMSAGSTVVVTGPGGEFQVDGSGLGSIVPVSGQWSVPRGGTIEEILRTGELWVYRTASVRALLLFDGDAAPPDAEGLEVRLTTEGAGGGPAPEGPGLPGEPRTFNWYRAHGMDLLGLPWTPLAPHEVRLRVPLLSGGSLAARLPGWRTARVDLDDSIRLEDSIIRLVFRKAFTIRGRLTGEDGRPLPGRHVRAYTTRHMRFADVDTEKLLRMRGEGHLGITARQSESRDLSVVTSRTGAPTGEDGSFEVEVLMEGDVVLVVWEQGLSPVHHPLGPVRSDVQDIGLVAAAGDPDHPVRVLFDGKPLANHQVILGDHAFPDAQPAVSIVTDERGALSSAWFVRGHEYSISAIGPLVPDTRGRWLVWQRQDLLELERLPLTTKVLTARGR